MSSCVLPDSVGPYAESGVPPGWHHDFVGVGGVEAMWGSWVVGAGVMHPDDGNEEYLMKIGYQWRLK